MRFNNLNLISGLDSANHTSIPIGCDQNFTGSFQFYFGDSNAAGTCKVQMSNDPVGTTLQNWTDVPNGSSSITSGASAVISLAQINYRWVRALYTSTAIGVQHIVTVADTGALESDKITAPAGATAVQGDYFVLTRPSGAKAAIWLAIDGVNTAPTGAAYVAAGTKTKVSILSTDADTVVAAAIQAATATVIGYTAVDNLDGTITYTQGTLGTCTAPAVHNANDSGAGTFAATVLTAGAASNLNSKYFEIFSAGQPPGSSYYVWLNVSTNGVDPVPAGLTAVPVAITAGASNSTVATAVSNALAAVNSSADFTTSVGGHTITVTNKVAGPFTAAFDFNTGFTISAVAGGTSTVTCNAMFLSF